MNKKKKKQKTVYLPDNGDTIYSMSGLYGRTPEEQEEYEKKLKNRTDATWSERWAMIKAAFTVYGPLLLIVIGAFGLTVLLLSLYIR
jgi:hypothetical protein